MPPPPSPNPYLPCLSTSSHSFFHVLQFAENLGAGLLCLPIPKAEKWSPPTLFSIFSARNLTILFRFQFSNPAVLAEFRWTWQPCTDARAAGAGRSRAVVGRAAGLGGPASVLLPTAAAQSPYPSEGATSKGPRAGEIPQTIFNKRSLSLPHVIQNKLYPQKSFGQFVPIFYRFVPCSCGTLLMCLFLNFSTLVSKNMA